MLGKMNRLVCPDCDAVFDDDLYNCPECAAREKQENRNAWIGRAADKDAGKLDRLMGIGWFTWVETAQGYEFWVKQYNRIRDDKDITPKARKALKEMIA